MAKAVKRLRAVQNSFKSHALSKTFYIHEFAIVCIIFGAVLQYYQLIFLVHSICRHIHKKAEEMGPSPKAKEGLLLTLCNISYESLGRIKSVVAGTQANTMMNLYFIQCCEFSKTLR